MEDQLIIIVWFTYFRLFLATTGVSVTAVSKIEVREPFPYIIFYSQLQGNKQILKGMLNNISFGGSRAVLKIGARYHGLICVYKHGNVLAKITGI